MSLWPRNKPLDQPPHFGMVGMNPKTPPKEVQDAIKALALWVYRYENHKPKHGSK